MLWKIIKKQRTINKRNLIVSGQEKEFWKKVGNTKISFFHCVPTEVKLKELKSKIAIWVEADETCQPNAAFELVILKLCDLGYFEYSIKVDQGELEYSFYQKDVLSFFKDFLKSLGDY